MATTTNGAGGGRPSADPPGDAPAFATVGAAELRTFGHATLVVTIDGSPCLATDPWLIGSSYWRSWWLERYPDPEEVELVRRTPFIYLTHSHPDHFHWSSLRMLGPRSTLHPMFPSYDLPRFLASEGFPTHTLKPWQRYRLGTSRLGTGVDITSIPIAVDDSILLIESAGTLVVDLNDGKPPGALLREIRREFAADKSRVFMLCSYSPASSAAAVHRDGQRAPMKDKGGYVRQAFKFADALGATHYVPFASQAVFRRSDSAWANELKVTFDDLAREWPSDTVQLCDPYTTIDLARETESPRPRRHRGVGEPRAQTEAEAAERESEEREFVLPDDFDDRLLAYLEAVRPLRFLYRRGIGWRLSSSGTERFYETRARALKRKIPDDWDVIVTLPDQVLYEALQNEILTDLGITMFIRVDTRVDKYRTRVLFILMGLRDYGHIASFREFGKFVSFYAAMMVPKSQKLWTKAQPLPLPSAVEVPNLETS